MRQRVRRGWMTSAVTGLVVLAAVAVGWGQVVRPVTPSGTSTATAVAPAPHGMYAYYYLWWSAAHWHDSLGPSFPYTQSPWPLPATLGATGCTPVSRYAGNVETDTPSAVTTQDDPAQITYDVQHAIAAGLSGFAVDWHGTGQANQTAASSTYSQRLALLVQTVDRADAAGANFHLWLSYEGSATVLTEGQIAADLHYLTATYGHDPAFDRSNGGRPTFVWVGSYKYPTSTVAAISSQYRSSWYFVGGYQWTNWTAAVAPYFDADSPYWSSQNPWTNPASYTELDGLAATLRSEGKAYFAPLSPGFDNVLDGGSTCVPRSSGATLAALYRGNAQAHPDGWLLISWNEITEGTYVTPQLQRYGGAYGGSTGYLHQLLQPAPSPTTASVAAATAPVSTSTTTTVVAPTTTSTTSTTSPPNSASARAMRPNRSARSAPA